MDQKHPRLSLEQSIQAVSALLQKAQADKANTQAHVADLFREGHRSGPEWFKAQCDAGKSSACVAEIEHHLRTLNEMKEPQL